MIIKNMKKILLGLFVATASMMTTSCDLDSTTRYGVVSNENAIESIDDAKNFVNGIYIQLRSQSCGDYLVFGDIQMDQFVGIRDNGNRLGAWSSGHITASDTDWADLYYASYTTANSVNYFLPKVEALIESGEYEGTELETLKMYKGVAQFARAYAYYNIFTKIVNYKVADLDTPAKGMQIVLTYDPSGNRGSYVGRSTIRESLKVITDDLDAAYAALSEYEANVSDAACAPNSIRVSSYVVEALQARLALETLDYATALAKAEDVINSGLYPLCEGADYANMWLNDEGTELLFVPFAAVGTGGFGMAENWIRNNQKNSSDYLPTAEALIAYEDEDIRFNAFFEAYVPLVVEGTNYAAYAFNKYPGNPALRTSASVNNLLNKAKPFRTSELYLIAAEAAYETQATGKAQGYLDELRAARITGYTSESLSGSALQNAIREERAKELIGEGFRLADLRRWGNGFTREAGYNYLGGSFPALMGAVAANMNNITYTANDYRFVWPIPKREMDVNPQLKGQQNPGY